MDKENYLIDIHGHATFRAYNTVFKNGQRNLWEKTQNPTFETPLGRLVRLKSREIAQHSQANLYNYAQGNVRVVFDSLYPLEKGFTQLRRVPRALVGKANTELLLQSILGIDPHQLKAIRTNRDYFQELLGQYAFLSSGQGKSPDGKYSYKLAGNWKEVQAILAADAHTIAVVVTIEGCHSLNCGLPKRKGKKGDTEQELMENIATIKAWKAAPFFVNLAHHFYNELTGHTRSLKPGIYQAVNQKKGMDEGITPLGWKVIHALLSRENGRRILIDTKHMSVKARKEYYAMVENHNTLNPTDRIPILCSHTGVNGFKTLKASNRKRDKGKKMKGQLLHNWAINISDEEIKLIADSDGLMGIMVDKTLLASTPHLNMIRSLENAEAIKDALLEALATNIFQIVKAVGSKKGWDVLALGSDYDGAITHLDPYHEAATLPDLQQDLTDFIAKKRFMEKHWHGYTPEEMMRKVMQTNALRFMEVNF